MIKVAIFDVDGVLLVPGKVFSLRIGEEYGAPRESVLRFFNGPFQECRVGKADLKEEIQKHIREWGWKGTLAELLEYWFSNECQIDERVLEIARRLHHKGVACYLGTNQEKYRTEYLKKRLKVGGLFEEVFSSASIGYLKKELEFFAFVLRELSGIKPEEIFFADDSEDNIENAKHFGVQAHHYKNFKKFEEAIVRLALPNN